MMKEQFGPQLTDFEAIRLRVASPDDIHRWSHGEVLRPETINYRTQKPEKDGLFCEKIFGPTKDWECYCGKYKRIRYKGIVCDKCGVEVTRSVVRRERMGHIDLAAPVSHIWFLRGVPSKIGLLLDMSVQNLEKVIYFANFIIMSVDEHLRQQTLDQIDEEVSSKRKTMKGDFDSQMHKVRSSYDGPVKEAKDEAGRKKIGEKMEAELVNLAVQRDEQMKELASAVDVAKKELKELKPLQVISEMQYQDLSLKYGHVFEAGIGAEAIRQLLERIDLEKLAKELDDETHGATLNKRRRLIRRSKLVLNLMTNKLRPEWMVMSTVPVIPPDLRPMVQLDGGRFAASDLNDLYRRVINRNNRLKKLIELSAPEVIQRNEKRMLQEAVDALIDNGARHGKTVTASTGQKRMLKSLADMLKGKQGRFRQNLLGKRVDYSGRSVIVVGPKLKLNQCGLPKRMALELFKPFVISELIKRELVYNVRSANRFIESGRPEVWDILEEVTASAQVMLNRAPTLHRLGIQAFHPILIEGKAIQVHPLVCVAYNADFDGDQMAVYVPLTEEAKQEAEDIMLSVHNLLKPATGEPIVTPNQDIVLGIYYMTLMKETQNRGVVKAFATEEEALIAYELRAIRLQEKIRLRKDDGLIETTVGRVILNRYLPVYFGFINDTLDKKKIRELVTRFYFEFGKEPMADFLDGLKDLSFKYLTFSGISWGMDDLSIPEKKKEALQRAEKEILEIQSQYDLGLLTDEERRAKVIATWSAVKSEITDMSKSSLDKEGPVHMMIESGARGSWGQMTQMMGMKGQVINPAGETIELPVKASFKEGYDVLEYFISTHGARKGLTDTALRTANAGYLTRRLVDVSQDIVIKEGDCGDTEGFTMTKELSEEVGVELVERVFGRVLAQDLKDPKKKKVIAKKGQLVTENEMKAIRDADFDSIQIRSVLTCKSVRGVCQHCYGYDLGRNQLVEMGTAVGVIAAQSIGEPGTQLTMKTFHTGGVAGTDITQGLPRVEELFEARPIRHPSVISEHDGKIVSIQEEGRQKILHISYTVPVSEAHPIGNKDKVKVKDGATVKGGDKLIEKSDGEIVKAETSGNVKVEKTLLTIFSEKEELQEVPVHVGYSLWVKEGDLVTRGQRLTEGSVDIHELFRLRNREEVQRYVIREIQYIYYSQGQKLNDKHIEIIVRQMFSRYYVKEPNDAELLSGDIVTHAQLMEENAKATEKGGKEAETENLLLGITKTSLTTESFLSAASFQETSRVLIDAAVTGKIDELRGLKENVIIGKMIPVGTGFHKK